MKIKTSDLIGPALDWAVAVAKGLEPRFFTEDEAYRAYVMESTLKHDDYVSVLRPNNRITPLAKFAGYNDGVCWKDTFSPSTDWSLGGTIIDDALVSTGPIFVDGKFRRWEAFGHGLKYDDNGEYIEGSDHRMYGPTRLIAALRCYVSSKLGDGVNVPEELGKT